MELAETQCYEFECFEDNYSLTISPQAGDVGLTRGSLIPEEHSLYRALKHCVCQHKLNLNLSKTKQPLPVIINSDLNFRYLTVSANLQTQKWKIDLRHT